MPLPGAPEIPIVGMPMKVLTWYPTAIVQCLCDPDSNMVILVGIGRLNACQKCKTVYRIGNILGQTIHVERVAISAENNHAQG